MWSDRCLLEDSLRRTICWWDNLVVLDEAAGLPEKTGLSGLFVAYRKDKLAMSRMSMLSSPLLLGFEEIERLASRGSTMVVSIRTNDRA